MMPFVAVLAMNPCEYSRRRRGNRGNISPMKTLREMLAEARQVVPEEGPEDLQRRLKSDAPPAVIDVRDPDEYRDGRSEEHTSELQSHHDLVCRLLLEKKKQTNSP